MWIKGQGPGNYGGSTKATSYTKKHDARDAHRGQALGPQREACQSCVRGVGAAGPVCVAAGAEGRLGERRAGQETETKSALGFPTCIWQTHRDTRRAYSLRSTPRDRLYLPNQQERRKHCTVTVLVWADEQKGHLHVCRGFLDFGLNTRNTLQPQVCQTHPHAFTADTADCDAQDIPILSHSVPSIIRNLPNTHHINVNVP